MCTVGLLSCSLWLQMHANNIKGFRRIDIGLKNTQLHNRVSLENFCIYKNQYITFESHGYNNRHVVVANTETNLIPHQNNNQITTIVHQV